MFENLTQKIKKVKNSIVAIGFNPNPQQITIIGSGFAVSDDGRILTAAHLFNQITPEQQKNLKAFAVVEEDDKMDFARYQWKPISLINKDDQSDLALFQLDDYKNSKIKKLDLGDSDTLEIGQDIYFIGYPYAAQLMNDGFGVTLIVNKAIVSNIKRDGRDERHRRSWLILDAISNPGNSGCPLIDMDSNKVIGVMTISFRTQSRVQPNLDIREPMHICAAKPINLAKNLLNK